MFKHIRQLRHISLVMVFAILFQVCFPTFSYALTSGPAQPEFTSFEPVGTTQMVDLFSGDFTYNIPLFELPGPEGGYPFNLAYHSGRTMEEEASWVGLGWTLNHGAISRQMRGLPDDFNGEEITQTIDMKPDVTWAGKIGPDVEIVAFDKEKLKTAQDAKDKISDFTKETNPKNASASIVIDYGVTYNSYRGWGLTYNAGINNSRGKGNFKWGIGFSAGSFEAASIQPSIGVASMKLGALKLGLGIQSEIDSREGLKSIGINKNVRITETPKKSAEASEKASEATIFRGRGQFTFGKSSYTPTVGLDFLTSRNSASIELGKYITYSYVGGKLDVSKTRRNLLGKLGDEPAVITNNGYGYFYQQNSSRRAKDISDLNRELDGTIRPTTPNLAIPQMTQDIYSVMGQGTGGVYQPFRSDFGKFGDPYAISLSGGIELGGELNFSDGVKLGIDAGGDWGYEESGRWYPENADFDFEDEYKNKNLERFYFKSAGEITADKLENQNIPGESSVVSYQLDKQIMNLRINDVNLDTDNYKTKSGEEVSIEENTRKSRSPRKKAIQSYTNKDILDEDGEELLGLFDVKIYQDEIDTDRQELPSEDLDRSSFQEDHIAGFTDLEPNGLRYVYGLPVYNLKQKEYKISINPNRSGNNNTTKIVPLDIENNQILYKYDNTNEYFEKKEIPEYVHTYLLTSVVGADYIDADDIPGPSYGDKGYWVKFNYKKTNDSESPYKWRSPFGNNSTFRQVGTRGDAYDDIGVYSYGEREQYFLASAETRTHIAYFDLDEENRNDGRGVKHDFKRAPSTFSNISDQAGVLLNKIELYTKDTRNPELYLTQGAAQHTLLKTVNFDYDYSLCPGVENNATTTPTQNGKLTLNKVSFQYEDSNRGALSPYKFEYNTTNPSYSVNQVDRWGTYLRTNINYNIDDFPYTPQNDRQAVDEDASAWNISRIITPSGAAMDIQYEADDYAYVQDRAAMQMVEITGIGNVGATALNLSKDPDEASRRVYFKPKSNLPLTSRSHVRKYLENLHGIKFNDSGDIINSEENQLLFRISSKLFPADTGGEEVRGYSSIVNYGLSGTNPFIVLGTMNAGDFPYHPFCAVGWQIMKESYGHQLNGETISDTGSFKDGVKKFGQSMKGVFDFFRGFYSSCSKKGYAGSIELDRSFIRLCSPDKVKFGGGVRVKQIELDDNWSGAATTYGQVFDYTKEEDGEIISSGVATNEPAIAYEECALRYGKFFTHEARHVSTDYLTLEYPLNAAYYPGASVGYSEVKVKSLATHYADVDTPKPNNLVLPVGDFGTTGMTVHEFYTAHDFPVLTQETEVERSLGIPRRDISLGEIRQDYYTGVQGYAITLNDMHGKPRKVSQYGSDKSGDINEDAPINSVEYEYHEGESMAYTSAGKQLTAKTLMNNLPVLTAFDPSIDETKVETQELGVQYEFFTDMREYISTNEQTYFGFNIMFDAKLPFPIPAGVPTVNIHRAHTKTAVTNKIIRKHGILKSVKAYDGQSTIITTNEVYDPLTGGALLTSVNNMYDDQVYNLSVPARYAYEGMGAAYKNIGMIITPTIAENTDDCEGNYVFVKSSIENVSLDSPDEAFNALHEGDELTLTLNSEGSPVTTARIVRITNDAVYLNAIADINLAGDVEMKVVRSGRRNLVSAPGASIVALSNPLEGWETEYNNNAYVSVAAGTENFNITAQKIDGVLEAGVVTYDDKWIVDGECKGCGDDGGGGGSTLSGCSRILDCIVYEYDNDPSCASAIADELGVVSIELENGVVIQEQVGIPTDGYGGMYNILSDVPQNLQDQMSVSTSYYSSPIFCSETPITNFMITEHGVCEENVVGQGNFHEISDQVSKTSIVVPCDGPPLPPSPPCNDRYASGEKGIWRPKKSYTYLSDRSSSASTANVNTNVDLEKDGVIDDMPLFNWDNPWFVHGNQGKDWRQTSAITKYSEYNDELENRDILGRYQAALFGYKNTLSTAVAGNARYNEIAFQSFEEFPIPASSTSESLTNLEGVGASDNFLFTQNGKQVTSEAYDIVGFYEKNKVVYIDKPFSTWTNGYDYALLNLVDVNGNKLEVTADITSG